MTKSFCHMFLLFCGLVLSCCSIALPLLAQLPAAANCGVTSVISLADMQGGKDLNQEQIRLIEKYPGEEVSLQDVRQMARMLDMELVGVKAELSVLARSGQPFIMHLKGPEHFVAVDAATEDGMRGMESKGYVFYKQADLKRRFSGFALVPKEPKNSLEVGANLQLNVVDHNAGVVERDTVLTHRFNITNSGTLPLTIAVKDVSCGCTSVDFEGQPGVSTLVLEPSESRKVKIEYAASTVGELLQYVRLGTNDPQRPLVTLTLRGYVSQLLKTSVDSIRMAADKGKVAETSFSVLSPPDTIIQRIECEQRHLHVEYKLATSSPDYKKWKVSVRQDAQMPVGERDASIVIYMSKAAQTKITIPVRSVVRGTLRSSPEQIFLGLATKGETKSIDLRIHSLRGTPFRILGWKLKGNKHIQLGQEVFLEEIDKSNINNAFEKTVRVRVTPATTGLIGDSIIFQTDVAGEEFISVSLTGLVDA